MSCNWVEDFGINTRVKRLYTPKDVRGTGRSRRSGHRDPQCRMFHKESHPLRGHSLEKHTLHSFAAGLPRRPELPPAKTLNPKPRSPKAHVYHVSDSAPGGMRAASLRTSTSGSAIDI